ncbi:MAG: Cytoplasmic axial filament protein CafA and Ribonuclease G [Ignavibacteriae bacterium]|nr:MAG: Cytoplasmic axial filament protein CafA and Ribonuclease G [Ignavibacteriota bacterium]
MKKEIIINATANEIRIAITEDGRLAELYVESPEKERMVGDIYLGRVARVMPGIKAAFIDIGMKQDAFLHFSDIVSTLDDYSALIGDEDADVDTEEDLEEEEEIETPTRTAPVKSRVVERKESKVSQKDFPQIKKGQEIIVQVTKEPVGKKGVRVTSEVSLAGRFLVLMPFNNKIGVSKKITNFKEKRRLRRIVRNILPEGFGAIIRTVAMDQDEDLLKQDLEDLIKKWREIEQTIKNETPPALIYKDLSTTSSVIRDLFSEDVERVVVDSKKLHREIRLYVKWVAPNMVDKIEYYKGKEPIFDAFGIEKDIAVSLSRKVWLKSGGYIIIEQTEAMVVIDVNSGRYAAKKEQEMNSLRTNLEAAREIARQLRLRDIGGIIVVDFIDMEDEKNKKKVYDELKKEFKKDRAKVTVLPLTEFSIAQITRQRIRQSILHSFSEPCPVCGGGGLVLSKASVVNHIERWIRRFKADSKEYRLRLFVHPSLVSYLKEGTISKLTRLMMKFRLIIKLMEDPSLGIDEFRFYSVKQNKDITDLYNI